MTVLGGREDLEIVGEASYQDSLWSICGGQSGERVRHPVVAVLVPEPANPHDSNAIAISVDGHLVGYLCREDASVYVAGLRALMDRHGSHVALHGVIVGGGYYPDGPGRLGVWLDHDPADFGLSIRGSVLARGPGGRPVAAGATMRTGFTEAWLSDADDDSYDLSWYDELPDGDRSAIAVLRDLLAEDPDPIDRHFQFAELETRLYRCRDLYPEALVEFDDACRQHDREMEIICAAFLVKWDKVPLLETYRQMAIRQQKAKDWEAMRWWSERGLELYGNDAAREDAVEDLLKRRNRALAKLEPAPLAEERPKVTTRLAIAQPDGTGQPGDVDDALETLTCGSCMAQFERMRVRGRKPGLCPNCRIVG